MIIHVTEKADESRWYLFSFQMLNESICQYQFKKLSPVLVLLDENEIPKTQFVLAIYAYTFYYFVSGKYTLKGFFD